MLDFLQISIADIIDIILVALLIFYVFRVLRGTAAMTIFTGVLMLYLVWVIVSAFNMQLTSAIMGQVLGVGLIALVIIFQPELRRFLFHLGSKYNIGTHGKEFLGKIFHIESKNNISTATIEELTGACRRMSESKTGALIVLRRSSALEDIIETGDKINADINRRLIENIFFKNSPLHDGALIITREKMIAARCTLPLTDTPDLPADLGMRHRAAIGVTETTDADAIVVSEETGNISFVKGGEIKVMGSITELHLAIKDSFENMA